MIPSYFNSLVLPRALLVGAALLLAVPASGQPKAIVAVAASFKPLLSQLLAGYPDDQSWQVVSGSSGKITSQVLAGANFALFLSADETRPRLIQQKRGLPASSVFRYGGGRLAFYGPGGSHSAGQLAPIAPITQIAKALGACSAVAVANPRHAPYGVAAHNLLAKLNLSPMPKIITGQSVAQVAQFLRSQAVSCGLLALSYRPSFAPGTLVAVADQPPIWQAGIVLSPKSDQAAFNRAMALRRYLLSAKAQQALVAAGFFAAGGGDQEGKEGNAGP